MNFDIASLIGFGSSRPTRIVNIRTSNSKNAIILLHGFTGEVLGSWDGFYQLLIEDSALDSWDIFGISYPSTPSLDSWAILRGDPSLTTLSLSLSTTLKVAPFERYNSLAIAAHSMGGLFVQRAIIDDSSLRQRLTHLALYGTPSNGVATARLISALKKQARDMTRGSDFLVNLRKDWNESFPEMMPFSFVSIAGDIDEFVPVASSIEPFAPQYRSVVAGDHSTIIRPTAHQRQGVDVLRNLLAGTAISSMPLAAARLDLEEGEFQRVVQTLLPNASSIDEAALSSLALALDGLGRGNEAISLLEEHLRDEKTSSTEAMGILAGRVKRRWLVERRLNDLERATGLYQDGYTSAAAANDHQQGYYHAINLSFLSLMAAPLNANLPAAVEHWAEKALWHCERAPMSNWRVATQAEANLILGRSADAYAMYTEAVSATNSPRQLGSMYSQASRIAERTVGDKGLLRIKVIFDRFHN